MAKKRAMLVLDSQKLELSIPFKEVYDFASATLKKIRFNAAKKFIQNEKNKGTDVKVVALDGRTEDFFKKENIDYIRGSDITEGLYDVNYGEISFKFLRNIIKTIEEIDAQATYRGILLPDLDEKNLWRSFVYPTLKSVDVFSGLIKKYRPQEAIILNRAHFYQKLFMLTAESKGLVVDDMSGTFSHLPWKAKEYAIKNLGFLNYPSYFRGLKAKPQKTARKTKKKILVAHDYISPKKVIPWAKKLAKKYEVVYVGTKESGEEFEKAGIKYRKLQDYATETALSSIKVQKTIFRKDYKHVFGHPKLKNALFYKNVNLASSLEEMFMFLYHISYPVMVTYIELFNEMIEQEQPDLIVTVDDRSRFGRAIIAAGSRREIKTLIVQHGAIYDHALFDKSSCTKFAAYGKQTEKILTNRGVEKSRVSITGQAEDIPPESKEKIRTRICTQLNISAKKPVITFASQAVAESINYPSFVVFYKAVKELPEIQFVIKLHPDESDRLHKEFIRNYGVENVTVIREVNLKELLVASDLLVNLYSTVGMEAISLGTPLISINTNLPGTFFPSSSASEKMLGAKRRARGNGAYVVRHTKHLKSLIDKIVLQKKGPSIETVKKTSRYYIAEIGEKACNNVVKLIDKMILKK